jgi:PAS domain S-box-containing protein
VTPPFSEAELTQRIRWYIQMRWWYIIVIAGPGIASLIIQYGLHNHQVMQDLEIAAAAVVLNTLMFAATYWHPRWGSYFQALAVIQIGFDIVLMTGAFFFNSGLETPIVMLYCIPILMSGAILGRQAIYLTGVGSAAIVTFLSLLDFTDVLKPGHIAAPQLHTDPNNFLPTLVISVSTLLTITVISDYVGRLVRQRSQLEHDLEEVKIERAKVAAIIKTMGSALVALDNTGRITMVNDNFEYTTGWERAEVLGQPFDKILPMIDEDGHLIPAAERPSLLMSAMGRGHDSHVRSVSHYSYVRKDGTSFPFFSNLAPIVLDRRVIGLTNVFDDITAVQKLEQLKTNFVALVSHQLKTPIGEIRGYVNNMLYGVGGKLTKKQTEYLGEIRAITERCNKLITDLLDITILERGGLTLDIKAHRLAPIIKQVSDIYHDRLSKKGLSVKIIKPSKELTVLADSDKLVEALGNVLANAISYSKQGVITIETKALKDSAEILVKDQGTGMDKTTVSTLFNKDTSLSGAPTAEGGTGLGLYLARQLIYLQNGDITVASTSHRGTTISIMIPLEKG